MGSCSTKIAAEEADYANLTNKKESNLNHATHKQKSKLFQKYKGNKANKSMMPINLLIYGYIRKHFIYNKIPVEILNEIMNFAKESEIDFFESCKIKKEHHLLNKLNINQKLNDENILGIQPISKWDNKTNSGGAIQIYSEKAIVIGENGAINLDGAGYSDGYGRGEGGSIWDTIYGKYGGGGHATAGAGYYNITADGFQSAPGGKAYGNKALHTLSYGSPSGCLIYQRGGGIIELISPTIINYGIITASGIDSYGGSGGSIKIKAKTFKNYGTIKADGGKGGWTQGGQVFDGGYGYIAVYCESFENQGNISPSPYIQKKYYFQNSSFSNINDDYLTKKKISECSIM